MKFNYLVSVALVLASSGCALSQTELMQKKTRYEFSVEQPYQDVFATVLSQVKKCYRDKPVWDQLAVNGTRNNRDRTGLVVVDSLYNEADSDTRLVVEVKAVADAKTDVVAYYNHSWDRHEARAVEKWVKEKITACRV